MYSKKIFAIGVGIFIIALFIIASSSNNVYNAFKKSNEFDVDKIIIIINIIIGLFLIFSSYYIVNLGYIYDCAGCRRITLTD
jgi:ABC-type nickel/cobalt efflux system permease component RcnA